MTTATNPRNLPRTPVTTSSLRPYLLICLLASCAVQDLAPPAPTRDLTVDALAQRPADPAKTAALLATAKSLVRPGSAVQTEPRLGVPTFLWARDPEATGTRARWLTAGIDHPEIAASRAALADYAPLYGLADTDVAGAVVASVHDLGTGPILVKFRGQLGGIEIFREELNVVLNRKLEPIALTGYLSGAATPTAHGLGFKLDAPAAALTAINHLAGTAIDAAQLAPAGSRDGYDYFTLAATAGVTLDDPVRLKKVYYHAPDGLEPAYYVEVLARTGAPQPNTASIDGSPLATPEAYGYVVSAATGQPLFRQNLISDAVNRAPTDGVLPPGGFTYRVWADPVTGIPLDTPAGNAPHPKANPFPDGAQSPFVAPSDVTLANFPFSQNDPWIAATATQTVGNNVDAFLDLFSPDGITPTAPPSDPPTGDFRAQITGPGQFLHAQTPDGNGATAEGRQGAIQQLFYDLNFLHDWYYDAGFNEAAGNAQTNNFGRGGLGNDAIKGQAQDFSGFNNANMNTPADGGQPRMRMYVFPSPANMLDIQAPAAITGKKPTGVFMAGAQTFDLTADIVAATFTASPTCTITNAAALAGKIALFNVDNVDGTNCALLTRLQRIQATTAAASLAISTSVPPSGPVFAVSFTGFIVGLTRPMATVSFNDGNLIKAQLAAGQTVTARLFRAADRDGALDAQIVFHEFFHYVSNRLVGNGAGLASQHAAGMGEGWSDFNAMLLTVREDDTAVPSNATFNGAYALATYATSGVPFDGSANQGYYFGIRRYPYSTDMTKNPLTFRHITNNVALPVGPPLGFGADGASNAEVHNTGEVWATMLWECYAGLLRDTLGPTPRLTFQAAQDRMKRYLIGALKVTPPFPTFTEARDALLAVSLASDSADYVAFRLAFAKRGAGPRAVSPDRLSTTNAGVIEDFAAGPELQFDSATFDDSLGGCDQDGVVDHGEYGKLTVTLRNTGTTTLAATTAVISSTSPDVWYPSGTTLTFPTIVAGATATASLRVAYVPTVTGIQQVDFQISYTDPQLTAAQTKTVGFRTNTDAAPASSATDTVETTTPAATTGFAAALGNVAPWHRLEVSPIQHLWHVDDPAQASDQYLISPPLTVGPGGALNLQFDHSWSFEFDAGGNYDGGVVEISINGAAFTDLGTAAYNGTIFAGSGNPIGGRRGFVQSSNGTVHTSLTRTIAAGSTVQVRFRATSDDSVGVAGWNVDNVAYTGVVETPFATLVADTGDCAQVPTSADLAIAVTDGVTSVHVGDSVTYTITATNAGGGDIIGATVTDAFPTDLAACTWTCAATAGGTCAASGTGNLLDHISLPVGGVATYTATCAVPVATTIRSVSNTASIALPGPVTDPVVANNTATDTDTVLQLPAHLTGSKTVTGRFLQGSNVTYTITLHNNGAGRQLDNDGDELSDRLPDGLTLVSATATSGTAAATIAANTVTWNGEIAAGGSVVITIVATITAPPGALVSNQAAFHYDSDGDGTNNATGSTDAFVCTATP